ncbi:MAG: MerR family transcriptional regulator [Proteobacteria bacterium]|nr:MerR family transcriptional regulator [Pseudomonadota bacterium]
MDEKKYFKIGEVCKIADIKPHILRYWEREIRDIRPERSLKNQRLYSKSSLEKIIEIKKLLDSGYRLEVVKKNFSKNRLEEDKVILFLQEVKRNLQKIRNLLE